LGGDLLDGGNGTDTATYSEATGSVSVSMSGWASGGEAAGDTLVSIENINGSEFADVISGDGNANRLDGRGGDDILAGFGGADVLVGGTGNDQFQWWAGSGNDFISDFTGGGGVSDVMRLFGTSYSSFAQLQAAPGVLVQTAGQNQTEIRLGAETIYIWGILPGQFAADDFLFA
jgi:Ca2+-binding RTX toxin-like protein